jgi:hypothetical protein
VATVRIPLHSHKSPGLYALIDEGDAELVSRYRWNPSQQKNGLIYARAFVPGTRNDHVLMHRLILGLVPRLPLVDHENHDGLDNRRKNIRVCTNQQNLANARRVLGSSRFRGVHRHWQKGHGQGGWVAQITVNGKRRYLGHFGSEEQAARTYDIAALAAFGEWATLNFPIGEECGDGR